MFGPLDITARQLVVGSVVLAIFFPSSTTFIVLLKKLGLKDMLKATGIMIVSALLVGSILNLIL